MSSSTYMWLNFQFYFHSSLLLETFDKVYERDVIMWKHGGERGRKMASRAPSDLVPKKNTTSAGWQYFGFRANKKGEPGLYWRGTL